MDLIQSLKSMENVQNSKKKTESLQNELNKIDNELFELEKKYGEYRVKKSNTITKGQDNSNDSNDISGTMPAVESSSMTPNQQIKEQAEEEIKEEETERFDE